MINNFRTGAGPLGGVRVIDCSRGLAGTRATGILADYGADVIWIEPLGGDPYRESCRAAYSVFNRGKRSIVLDLHDPGQRETLDKLLATADVFIQSWRPGVAEKFGLGFGELHEQWSGLVCASISGFGVDDSAPSLPGYESLVHARIGSMGEQIGHHPPPIYEGLPFASIGAAYLSVIGVLAALYRSELDGVGRHVETSLVDGALAYLSMMWGDSDAEKERPPLAPGQGRLVARSFRCQDDEYIGIHSAAVGAFGRLMKALGLNDRIKTREDGRDVGVPLTPEEAEIILHEVPEIIASKPRAYWLETLLEADVCAIPELRPCEVFDERQVKHNNMVVTIDDPELGSIEQVAPAIRFSGFQNGDLKPAPLVDEHREEILSESEEFGSTAKLNAQTSAHQPGSPRPVLEGVKILDLGMFYAGPYSSRLLADLGADVIKLETLAGDQLRGIARPFRSCQAGKRALSVNLKSDKVRPVVDKLVDWADVIHHNMRPGAAERLGLDYESIHARSPGTVYLYAPGWGSSGPDSRRQSFAPLLSGYVGINFIVAGEWNQPLFPIANEDPGNGMLGAVGALVALLYRQRSKEAAGLYVENPQLNATMSHVAHIIRRADGEILGWETLDTLQRGLSALDRIYETSEGHICIAVMKDAEISALSGVTGVAILGDARFDTPVARKEHDYELAALLEGVFAERSTDEWVSLLGQASVPAAVPKPHNNLHYMRDTRNQETGRVAEVRHPELGAVRELAQLIRISDSSVAPHRLAPGLGEHTDEIFSWAGFTRDEIEELRGEGLIK